MKDGSAAVKAKVERGLSKLPRPIKNQAALRASELTTPGMIAQYLSNRMIAKLPRKMKKKGLTVKVEQLFREGPYVVLELDVLHVDPVLLTAGKGSVEGGDGFSGFVQWFIGRMGEGFQRTIEEDYRE